MFRSRIVGIVLFYVLSVGLRAHATAAGVISVATPSVLSFKEWKADKSIQVKARYQKLEAEYMTKKAANPKDTTLKSLYNDLKDTKSHVDEIGEFTVSDYFVGYLSRLKDRKKAFHLAAEKLDTQEMAELMTAYAESLLKTSGEGISTSQSSSTSTTEDSK